MKIGRLLVHCKAVRFPHTHAQNKGPANDAVSSNERASSEVNDEIALRLEDSKIS